MGVSLRRVFHQEYTYTVQSLLYSIVLVPYLPSVLTASPVVPPEVTLCSLDTLGAHDVMIEHIW